MNKKLQSYLESKHAELTGENTACVDKVKRRKFNTKKRSNRKVILLLDYNHRCAICNITVDFSKPDAHPNKATIDHIRPLAKGGSDTKENLQLLCFPCNNKKADTYEPTDTGV